MPVDEYVISADEKSQLQALHRRHRGLPAAPARTAAGGVRIHPRRNPGLLCRLRRPPSPRHRKSSRPRPGSPPSPTWSPRWWARNRTPAPGGCSGSWTTAPAHNGAASIEEDERGLAGPLLLAICGQVEADACVW